MGTEPTELGPTGSATCPTEAGARPPEADAGPAAVAADAAEAGSRPPEADAGAPEVAADAAEAGSRLPETDAGPGEVAADAAEADTSPTGSGGRRRRWPRRLAVAGIGTLLVAAGAGGYAWNRGWLTPTYLAAARSCGTLQQSPAILPPPDSGPLATLTPVTSGVFEPTALSFHPRLDLGYLAGRAGRVRAVRAGAVDAAPLFDLAGDLSIAPEQGLLGLVVDPAGEHLYAYLNNAAHDMRLVAIPLDPDGQPQPDRPLEIIGAHLPDVDHNGGGLAFGPDGMLYVGVGDGGEIGDRQGFAQSTDSLLGKVLRIDPHPGADPPYAIPPGNPFIGRTDARPEIWVMGVRNPWRLAFAPDGRLWLPDLGHKCMEEVNLLPAGGAASGANLGWNRFEGTRTFLGGDLPGRIDPVFEYPHDDGSCAVIGGVVVRDPALTGLSGSYLVADLCRGALLALTVGPDTNASVRDTGVQRPLITSFASDTAGRVWILTRFDGIFRLEHATADH